MKAYKFLLLVVATVLFVSCEDRSGKYVKYIYTDAELKNAYNSCLTLATDTALAHLCVTDGFYMYDNQSYRITLPSEMNFISDTLRAHGQGALIDTFVLHINRAAELGGDNFRKAFVSSINSLTYVNPNSFLSTNDLTALTSYLSKNAYNTLYDNVLNTMILRMNSIGIPVDWSAIVQAYEQYAPGTVVTCNFYENSSKQVLDGLLIELGKEETLIRTDKSHRVTEYTKLVFN